jgi:hypothetical protein
MNKTLEQTIEYRQKEIIASVEALTYKDNGITYIRLENYALDFNIPYQYHGFTKSGNVRLGREVNGRVQRKIGRVEDGYLRTEGSRYSVRLNQ